MSLWLSFPDDNSADECAVPLKPLPVHRASGNVPPIRRIRKAGADGACEVRHLHVKRCARLGIHNWRDIELRLLTAGYRRNIRGICRQRDRRDSSTKFETACLLHGFGIPHNDSAAGISCGDGRAIDRPRSRYDGPVMPFEPSRAETIL